MGTLLLASEMPVHISRSRTVSSPPSPAPPSAPSGGKCMGGRWHRLPHPVAFYFSSSKAERGLSRALSRCYSSFVGCDNTTCKFQRTFDEQISCSDAFVLDDITQSGTVVKRRTFPTSRIAMETSPNNKNDLPYYPMTSEYPVLL